MLGSLSLKTSSDVKKYLVGKLDQGIDPYSIQLEEQLQAVRGKVGGGSLYLHTFFLKWGSNSSLQNPLKEHPEDHSDDLF